MKKKKKLQLDNKRTLIYCRVSSEKQVKEGHGLESQEVRCVQKAKELGLEVAAIFSDEGISGGLADRPAMKRLIAYLDANPNEKFVVIFDDLKRFARDVVVHYFLKSELIAKRGAVLECLNFKFENSPMGRAIEGIAAVTAQLEREQNAEQVVNKMKARLQLGYWPFYMPAGLKYIKDPMHGKLLAPHEPLASIYKSLFEKIANYELLNLEDSRQFVLSQYSIHGIHKKLSINGVQGILSQVLYAGYIRYEAWGVELQPAKHTGIVSYELFIRVQEILSERSHASPRRDYTDDFPLRNYVTCAECGRAMTAAFYKGKLGILYPKYKCQNKQCALSHKTIPAEVIHSQFRELLKNLTPVPKLVDLAEAILFDIWNDRAKLEKGTQTLALQHINKLELDNKALLERAMQATTSFLISAYEKQIEENIAKIEELKLNQDKIKYPHDGYQTILKEVLNYLKNPLSQWENADSAGKRVLLNMYFEHKLTYHPESGYQTPKIPFILEALCQKHVTKNGLVDTVEKSLNQIIDYVYRWYPWVKELENA